MTGSWENQATGRLRTKRRWDHEPGWLAANRLAGIRCRHGSTEQPLQLSLPGMWRFKSRTDERFFAAVSKASDVLQSSEQLRSAEMVCRRDCPAAMTDVLLNGGLKWPGPRLAAIARWGPGETCPVARRLSCSWEDAVSQRNTFHPGATDELSPSTSDGHGFTVPCGFTRCGYSKEMVHPRIPARKGSLWGSFVDRLKQRRFASVSRKKRDV